MEPLCLEPLRRNLSGYLATDREEDGEAVFVVPTLLVVAALVILIFLVTRGGGPRGPGIRCRTGRCAAPEHPCGRWPRRLVYCRGG
ncbi:hypothetical protein, partial [Streptomyces tirandamycinicus]|uniref:hypothetical protein n=1 Tax=Streptomyces tirandamycinicus TaxID=2174846 RepID=UPI00227205CB